jgi:hypothetical protein
LCSLSSKDVLGKVIPKQSRGKLKGYTSSVSGVLVLIAGLFLIYKSKGQYLDWKKPIGKWDYFDEQGKLVHSMTFTR